MSGTPPILPGSSPGNIQPAKRSDDSKKDGSKDKIGSVANPALTSSPSSGQQVNKAPPSQTIAAVDTNERVESFTRQMLPNRPGESGRWIGPFPAAANPFDSLIKIDDIADEVLQQKDLDRLDNAIHSATALVLSGAVAQEDKKMLLLNLLRIKGNVGLGWGKEYIRNADHYISEYIRYEWKTSFPIPEELKNHFNYLLNLLDSNAPQQVKQHPAYHKGLLIVDPSVANFRNLVLDKTASILKEAAEKPENRGKTVYLLRDSTIQRGPETIKVFTISFLIPGKEVDHRRFAFNEKTQKWQIPSFKDVAGKEVYDMTSSKIIATKKSGDVRNGFDTLEELVNFVLSEQYDIRPGDIKPAL